MSDTPDDDMPERVDPIDTAYAQAEALLDDEAARATRRARLLAAVASEPAPVASSVIRPARQDGGWGRGGWLAAACVAGLSVFVVFQIYRPVPHQPATAPAASIAVPPVAGAPPAAPAADASKPPAPHPAAPRAALPVAPALPASARPAAQAVEPQGRRFSAEPAPPPAAPPPAPPPPAQTTDNPASAAAPPPADSGPQEIVVTAEKRTQTTQKVPVAVSAFTAKQRDALGINSVQSLSGFTAKSQADRGAALRAAAVAGQVSEVEVQLREGAPVDAPDVNGDTALILSIRADQPDVAAVLRQHGASLDHRNHAGQSARDLAKAADDEVLSRALGLAP